MVKFLNNRRFAFLYFSLTATLVLCSISFLVWVNSKKLETINKIGQTYNSLIYFEKINHSLHVANTQKNGFILTGFEYYLDSYKKTIKNLPNTMGPINRYESESFSNEENIKWSTMLLGDYIIAGMDKMLKNRELSGLDSLKNEPFEGLKSGLFQDFKTKKMQFKNDEKNALHEKMILLKKWNLLFIIMSFLTFSFILMGLFLLRSINNNEIK